jgi:hypothetical protein
MIGMSWTILKVSRGLHFPRLFPCILALKLVEVTYLLFHDSFVIYFIPTYILYFILYLLYTFITQIVVRGVAHGP